LVPEQTARLRRARRGSVAGRSVRRVRCPEGRCQGVASSTVAGDALGSALQLRRPFQTRCEVW
jgi:hypothetical protein